MLKRIKKNVEFFESEEKIIMYVDGNRDESRSKRNKNI